MSYRWIISNNTDENAVNNLSQSINVSPTIARILAQRGITCFEDARRFFRPSLSDLHDPFIMSDMKAATERCIQAINDGEKLQFTVTTMLMAQILLQCYTCSLKVLILM
ncbi:MAG: hypothetical protein IPP65_09230 [Chlorobi bacterium]|nr:hypothetical protein [Chlorobiota bacterium]